MNEYCKLKNGEVMVIWSNNKDQDTMHLYPLSSELGFNLEMDDTYVYSYSDIEKKRCTRNGDDMEKEGPTVILDYMDIIEITNTMNNSFPKGARPSQGFLEWDLMNAIRKHTDTDFFPYLKELEDKKPD